MPAMSEMARRLLLSRAMLRQRMTQATGPTRTKVDSEADSQHNEAATVPVEPE